MARKLKNKTRELLLETLTKMGIEYEIIEDSVFFDFHDRYYTVEAKEDIKHIEIEDLHLSILDYLDDMRLLQKAINEANQKSDVTISHDLKKIRYHKSILFIEEIPNIADYLQTTLLGFQEAYQLLEGILKKYLEEDKKFEKIKKISSIKGIQTRDLFINTILEMGCTFEPYDEENNGIVIDYLHKKFIVYFLEFNHYINISHAFYFRKVRVSYVNEVKRLREAINIVNKNRLVTTVCEVPQRSKMLKVYSWREIPFMPGIPNLIGYLRDELDEFFCAESDIEDEMDKLKGKCHDSRKNTQ